MPTVAVRLTPEQSAWLDAQTKPFRGKSDVVRDLIDSARLGLDNAGTLGAPSAAGAPFYSSNTINTVLEEKKLNKRINKARVVSETLQRHAELIEEFWRVKKGSKGDTAWKLLQTELGKLQASYGDAVVAEQLKMAINGKWAGVSASRYEQFRAPRGGLQQPPEQVKHPASREFRNGRFVDDDGPTTNPALAGLF